MSATSSPRPAIRRAAVDRVHRSLTELFARPESITASLGGDTDAVLRVLDSLAGAGAGEIAALVPQLAAVMPDDPRLVEPLWRCMAVPGIDLRPEAVQIVSRLLQLAMDPECFEELMRQEPFQSAALSPELRRKAYPFERGYPRTSNLVSLLAWAERLDVVPLPPNAFFAAKVKAPAKFATVERDKRRTVTWGPFWLGRVTSVLGALAALAGTVAMLIIDWRIIREPWGWGSLFLYIGMAAALFGAIFLYVDVTDRFENSSGPHRYLSEATGNASAHFVVALGTRSDLLGFVLVFGVPISYAFAFAWLAPQSVVAYLVIVPITWLVLFLFPIATLFGRGTRVHLYRPNRYVDMYDDQRSAHWLVPARRIPRQSRGRELGDARQEAVHEAR